MKAGKHLAMLTVCAAVLWTSRFGPYACSTLPAFTSETTSSWIAITVNGLFLILLLYLPVYDLISLLTYKLGWETKFDPLVVYEGEHSTQPVSPKIRRVLYVVDLAIVGIFMLPLWTKAAYCG
ncbi:hypothetical protein MA20_04990 [Bradyrhizobium japonicum]|uniref:Uncharacterized protein n=1 Tax=Bradyrhizobium japonicum TaxID=375 RepID=A0A0A3Z4G0_BRAJP|nr:hypothetical protein [Bradyrhizobium japonicum]KGT80783.1 hypothetical protein MA20_04990 [Bradyrhizobium japonicum]MCS3892916.1 hypothetical protein [Bradyrhizobium japonicum USDA 38]MCS3945429.1 hypothetical protein [Bradyrhizobium japonicum]